MREIPLAPIPDQSFQIRLTQTLYNMRIFLANNVMCCDLSINAIPILSSQRIVSGSLIIPYKYLENGNFIITTLNDELPNYQQFGATQFLIFYTPDDLLNG